MKCGPVAKNKAAAATSCAVPLRCMGVLWAKCSYAAFTSPCTIIPGAMQLTLISGAQALAMVCESICKAALEVQ